MPPDSLTNLHARVKAERADMDASFVPAKVVALRIAEDAVEALDAMQVRMTEMELERNRAQFLLRGCQLALLKVPAGLNNERLVSERKPLPPEVQSVLRLYKAVWEGWACNRCGCEYPRDIITACPSCSEAAKRILGDGT